ncbi:MAG: hypothetical protein MJB14_10575 [Spirochaetes bacterium]|nr:hypothetical protein [Spirochaetota bacterium]
MSDKQNFLNKINEDRSGNINFGYDKVLKHVYQKVMNKTFRVNSEQQKAKQSVPKNPAERVMASDKQVRAAIQNLVVSLLELGDTEIALKLISNHIFFLNDIFTDFEKAAEAQQKQSGKNGEQ